MASRRVFLFSVAACLLLAVPFVVRWAMTPAPGVTEENFKRLHQGMALEEIRSILGRPEDETNPWYTWKEKNVRIEIVGKYAKMGGCWRDDTNHGLKLAPYPEPFFAKICRWFGL